MNANAPTSGALFRTGQRAPRAGFFEFAGFLGKGVRPRLKPKAKRRPIRMARGATFPPYLDRGVRWRPVDVGRALVTNSSSARSRSSGGTRPR
jgi:hypothetical protein